MNNSDLSYDTANQNPWKNPPLMISFSRESMTSNDVGRWAYGLEYLQLLTIRNYPGWTQNPFVGLGIVGNREGRRYAQGMSARAGVLFPEIEGTMSVFVRRQAHKSANASVLQNGYGFRVDMGFSSMLSAFLGGGIDFGFDSSDQPQRGKFFFGGLSLSFPQSQVLRLLP